MHVNVTEKTESIIDSVKGAAGEATPTGGLAGLRERDHPITRLHGLGTRSKQLSRHRFLRLFISTLFLYTAQSERPCSRSIAPLPPRRP